MSLFFSSDSEVDNWIAPLAITFSALTVTSLYCLYKHRTQAVPLTTTTPATIEPQAQVIQVDPAPSTDVDLDVPVTNLSAKDRRRQQQARAFARMCPEQAAAVPSAAYEQEEDRKHQETQALMDQLEREAYLERVREQVAEELSNSLRRKRK